MRDNLLEFLFGPSALSHSHTLGEDVVKLFEEAADAETDQMVANKKPLATALKSIGISNPVVEGPQCCEIQCDDETQHREHLALLADPDNMHKLAELGWVAARRGDQAMSNEPPDFRIGFIELNMLGMPDNKQDGESLETVLKNAQKFATTPLDREDKLNPVETDDKTSDDNQKGVGKTKDGANPEGKPKGAKQESEEYRPYEENPHGKPYFNQSLPSSYGYDMPEQEEFLRNKEEERVKKSAEWQTKNWQAKQKGGHHHEGKNLTAKQLASRMLDEMTTCSAIPTSSGPPIGIAGVPSRVPKRSRFRNKNRLTDEPREPNR